MQLYVYFICFVIGLELGILLGQFAGTNIALKKPANQTPGTYCAIPWDVCYNASRAVDGMLEKTGELVKGYCSHTQEQFETAASWSVDFGSPYYINGIRVYNRKPVDKSAPLIGSRLRDFKIYGMVEGQREGSLLYVYDYIFRDNQPYPVVVNISLPEDSYYSGITIQIPYRGTFEPTILTLCEVEVYSVLCEDLTSDYIRFVRFSDNLNNGSEATFICNIGYYLSHNYSLLCKNGNWSIEPPTCRKVFCPVPSIQNGRYKPTDGCSPSSENKSLSFNCTIEPQCDKGYQLIEGEKRVCTESGKWSESGPVCQLSYCTLPKDNVGEQYVFSNGSAIKGDTVSYGTNITVKCKIGLRNSLVRRCSQDGQWDGNLPVCGPGEDAAIIGGAAASAILLLLIIVLLLILKRRGIFRRKKDAERDQYESLHERSVQTAGSTVGEYQEIRNVGALFVVYQNTPAASSINVNYESVDQARKDLPDTAIPVQLLADFVFTNDFTDERFQKEFEKLPEAEQTRFSEALKFKNEDKNRYKGLYAYDDTRVVLDVETDGDTDYINACYVYGFQKKMFIASQGPTKELIADFWRMIWQTNCRKIVMLTNFVELGKNKCDQYWPNVGSEQYGTVAVTAEETDVYADFVVRKFTVRKRDSQARQVTHFHFTAWPDKGVPKYASSFILFRHKVNYMASQQEEPVVVHDSAGVGRTGIFIAMDYITDQAETLEYVDVYGCVKNLRQQRVKLVQTLDQYIFLYRAVVNTILLPVHALLSSTFQKTYQELVKLDMKTKKRKLDLQFETLKRLSPVAADDQYVSAKTIQNRSKNRFADIFPADEFMPQLSPDSTEEEYINAVFLPSYNERQAFIITQTPLDTTKADFWKLVWQNDIRTIIMMNHLKEMKEGEVYWPKSDEKLEFANISVVTDSKTTVEQHTVINMKANLFSTTRSVRLIQCGGWQPYKCLPDSTQVLLSLLDLVQTWQRQSGNHTVLVHCMNGAEKSGLYCVLAAVIERMKIEQDVAIPQVIEEIRNAREQIIPSVDQYRFCYEAVLEYIQMNTTYYNCTV